MRQIKVFVLVWAAIGLAACSSDGVVEDPEVENHKQPLPLTIIVNETPLQNTDAPASVSATRAPVTTTSKLTTFTLDYQYMRGAELQRDYYIANKDGNGKWVTDGFWPTETSDDTEVGWYAHTPEVYGNRVYGEETPYVSFTVEEYAAKQSDLLLATAIGSSASTGGRLTFTFDHACTALRFYVKKSTNLNDYTLTLNEIKLCNVVSQGKCYFKDISWTLYDTRTLYTLYDGDAKELDSGNYILLNANEDDFLFMIPQELTPWDTRTDIASATSQTYIMIECSLSQGETSIYSGTAYIPFPSRATTLIAGWQNDVKINIGKNSLYSGANTKIIQ